eukprot:CAMPEP_0170272394 /NCGR_PEP_ID=MMETSP0116_2-20130129/36150_1 /TAXON_ID=400756 /ORGANISM="Durinskia baltica, Strain CSIRO CS-38" /LENGTH=56 /DNA_ID=CAMNT_0010523603 /DNA_START=247 /DNA_END=414 /DNA_ORIENTATION=+
MKFRLPPAPALGGAATWPAPALCCWASGSEALQPMADESLRDAPLGKGGPSGMGDE